MRWVRRMRRMQKSGLSGGTPLSSGAGRFMLPCFQMPLPTEDACGQDDAQQVSAWRLGMHHDQKRT